MRYLTILLILLIGCKPIEKITDTSTNTESTDSLVTFTLDSDTLSTEQPIETDCVGLINSDTSSVSGKYAEASAWVFNSVLNLRLREGEAGKYKGKVTRLVRRIKTTITITKTITIKQKPKIIYEVHWYDYAARGIAILVILGLLFALKFVRLR